MGALFPHGWVHFLAGGLVIGLGVSLLFALTGRVGGLSTVYTSSWSWFSALPYFQQDRFVRERGWRLLYSVGLVLGAAAWWLATGEGGQGTGLSPGRLVVGGVLVGFGARLGNGCTSGHGICGLASLDRPSLVAVLTFMGAAFVTAWLVPA